MPVRSLGWEEPLELEINATCCSILAWGILWTEEPDGLQSMGSQGVGHDSATEDTHTHTHKWYCIFNFGFHFLLKTGPFS